MLFGMLGLAWVVTLMAQPTFVFDNNITRSLIKMTNVQRSCRDPGRPCRLAEECSNLTMSALVSTRGQRDQLQLQYSPCACQLSAPEAEA